MTILLPGSKPNLSYYEILTKVKNLITTNWTETSPALDDGTRLTGVTFNFDWFDDLGEFQGSFIHPYTSSDPENIGWTYMYNEMTIDIHLWVKQLTEEHPAMCGRLVKEIERILDDNKTALYTSDGISLILHTGFGEIPEEDNTSTLWHSVMNVVVIFRRVES